MEPLGEEEQAGDNPLLKAVKAKGTRFVSLNQVLATMKNELDLLKRICAKVQVDSNKIVNIEIDFNDLKDKVNPKDLKKAEPIILKGSEDMAKYLVGTAIQGDATIIGAKLDNCQDEAAPEFMASNIFSILTPDLEPNISASHTPDKVPAITT